MWISSTPNPSSSKSIIISISTSSKRSLSFRFSHQNPVHVSPPCRLHSPVPPPHRVYQKSKANICVFFSSIFYIVSVCSPFSPTWSPFSFTLFIFLSHFMPLIHHLLLSPRGSTVVKVLCYKSEGRWFDPSWCHWIFHWHKILSIALWPWGQLSL